MSLYRKILGSLLFGAALVALSWAAPAQGDGSRPHESLTPSNPRWNGLSSLAELAQRRGFHLSVPSVLVPRALGSNTVILAIEPQCSMGRPVMEFVRRGGWLVVADETGRLRGLWNRLRIQLRPSNRLGPALQAARVHGGHPLTKGLKSLWTNRPGVFTRARGRVLADLGAGGGAVILEISVGKGKVLAFSDASLFINLMLEYEENRILLDNFFDWAAASGKPNILLLAGSCRIQSLAPPEDDWIAMLRGAARRLDDLNPGPDVLFVAAVLLMGILLATLAWKLPLARSTYNESWVRAPGEPDRDSFAATVQRFAEGVTRDYSEPAIRLRDEMDRILATRLGMPAPLFEALPSRRSLSKSMSDETIRDFVRLHRLCSRLPANQGVRPVSRRYFSRMYDLAMRLLDGLDCRPGWMEGPAKKGNSDVR